MIHGPFWVYMTRWDDVLNGAPKSQTIYESQCMSTSAEDACGFLYLRTRERQSDRCLLERFGPQAIGLGNFISGIERAAE